MMYKFRATAFCFLLFPVFLMIMGCGSDSNAEPEKIYIHFFVAPKLLPDGTSTEEQIQQFPLMSERPKNSAFWNFIFVKVFTERTA